MVISIIMPVYNAEKTLIRSLQSIISQTNKNWELICVDDGSLDSSLDILRSFAALDQRIKVFSKENSGPGLTRNYAIEQSIGDYIGFLDSDDCWANNAVDLIFNNISLYGSDVIMLRTIMCQGKKCFDAFNVNKFSKMSNHDLICYMMTGILPWGQEKVIKASIIKDNSFKYSADSVGEEAIFSFDV